MLQNKTVFLTGGADGIGWECAKAYMQNGARLCIADKNVPALEKTDILQKNGHLFITCNVAREEEVQQAIQQTVIQFGTLDAIHNNAAVTQPSKPIHDTRNEEWDLLMEVNIKSILYTTRYGIEALKQTNGCILNTTSMVASLGQDNHAAYVATKGAVNALTRAMAIDYAPYKIRVNAVAPAAVNTPALEAWGQQQPNAHQIQKYLDNLHPLGKMPQGDVIADAAVFLLSHAARFITGCILPVSGGAELGYRTLL